NPCYIRLAELFLCVTIWKLLLLQQRSLIGGAIIINYGKITSIGILSDPEATHDKQASQKLSINSNL
ncbi:unnamed protein product, partial [marine sediment metagenome]